MLVSFNLADLSLLSNNTSGYKLRIVFRKLWLVYADLWELQA